MIHFHRWRRVVRNLTDYSRSPTLEHGEVNEMCDGCGQRRAPR